MESTVREWLMQLFNEAIDEARGTIKNETLWVLGSTDIESKECHSQNVETLELYISVLEGLKGLFD